MTNIIKNNRTVITIDCRELVPPEPMIKIMEAVTQMKDNEAILMLHRHSPRHLFSKLEGKDLKYELKEFEDKSVEILIWKEN